MEVAHRLLADAAVVAVAIGVVWSSAVVAGRTDRDWLDRFGLAVSAVLLVAAIAGLGTLSGGGQPGEDLHFIYGGLAVLLLPLARTFAGGWPRRDAWLTLGAWAVLAAIVYRLFATG